MADQDFTMPEMWAIMQSLVAGDPEDSTRGYVFVLFRGLEKRSLETERFIELAGEIGCSVVLVCNEPAPLASQPHVTTITRYTTETFDRFAFCPKYFNFAAHCDSAARLDLDDVYRVRKFGPEYGW